MYIFLYMQDSCDIDACTNENQTALHLAVFQGHLAIVERLVGYGAQLNIQDSNGSTPLHLALTSYSTEHITADTPQMKKVSYSLHTHQMCPVFINFVIHPHTLYNDNAHVIGNKCVISGKCE